MSIQPASDRSSAPKRVESPAPRPAAAKPEQAKAEKAPERGAQAARNQDTFQAAPAATGGGAPPPADIDPRIASEAKVQVNVKPQSEGAAGTMAVATVHYQDDQQSGGNHNVYVRVLGPGGKELPPDDVSRYFDVKYVPGPGMPETAASSKIRDPYGVAQDAWTSGANTGGPTGSYFDIPMYGGNAVEAWVQPKDVPGNPYADYGSQRVGPFSMPGNHHVNYLVSFQAVPGAGSAPAPAGDLATPPAGGQAPAANPASPAPAAGGMEGMVEGLYESLLGRPSDPGGKANWVGYGNHLLAQGKSEQEVKGALTTMFTLSDEYQARVASGQVAAPAAPELGEGTYSAGDALRVAAQGGLNVRTGQGTASERVGSLPDGAVVAVTAPPDGGPASRDGWVHVQGPGGLTGWVSEQYMERSGSGAQGAQGGQEPERPPAAVWPGGASSGAAGDGRLLGPDGQPQSFVAGNYTDLGRANGGQLPDPIRDEAGFRAAVTEDLARLQKMGVDNVRIWAADFPENNLGDNPEVLARRVSLIADEAAKRGMTVTVDLFDGNTMPKDTDAYRGREEQLSQRIATIVGQNAQRSNILWSVGNEIGDPESPADFAGWYEQKVGQIRDAVRAGGGDPSRPMISLQVTPGALGHPDHGWGGARAAMERVVAASDVISPHFYPPGAVGDLPWELKHVDGQVTYPQMDWSSVQTWINLANQAKKPVTIGEFGIPRNTDRGDPSAADYAAWSSAWMDELRKLGVDQVSFWQLAKNEGGHIDPASADLAWGPNAEDTNALLDRLRQGGWIPG